ncbi:MAG TPA: 3-oxoacyl-ACP reductase family protein [Woeseiaceae bacterium]|nr:3-oxoacyl-ACP reductase family protein [Woeseiaceae bacterium]
MEVPEAPTHARLLDLTGRVALVTGASQGIGAAIARRFAEAGAGVALHYRDREDAAHEVVRDIEARGATASAFRAELADGDAAARLTAEVVARFGRLDILVNNAGSFPTRDLLEIGDDDWREMFRSNVETAFFCLRAAARTMMDAGGGAIVNVASIAALVPGPAHAHYNSAKAAIVALTRSAAQELGRYNVRVNAVSPGLVARPGIESQWPEGVARWRARAPLGRLGEPADVADACLFLASPAARWITGHNLVVDGGMMSSPAY